MADDIANPASVVESKIESLVICTRKQKHLQQLLYGDDKDKVQSQN